MTLICLSYTNDTFTKYVFYILLLPFLIGLKVDSVSDWSIWIESTKNLQRYECTCIYIIKCVWHDMKKIVYMKMSKISIY